ncbi:hypothetical protein BH24ACT21_BH24ACT21_11120 [soil metagenome]
MDLPYLRNFRQRSIMSQEQLAERSGVARDTISKLETGSRKAYPSTIRKLANGLEVEPQILVGGVEHLEETQKSEETSEVEKPETTEKDGKKIGFQ